MFGPKEVQRGGNDNQPRDTTKIVNTIVIAQSKKSQDLTRPDIPHYGKKCLCDKDKPASGNECLKEENVTLGNVTEGTNSQCLFLRSAKEGIEIQQRRGSLSGAALVRWLQDVTFSGKRVRLRLDDGDEIKLAASNATGFETSHWVQLFYLSFLSFHFGTWRTFGRKGFF